MTVNSLHENHMRGLIALSVIVLTIVVAVIICVLFPIVLTFMGAVSLTSLVAIICIASYEWAHGIPLIEDDYE